jgi:hypothetical protein
MKKLLFVVVILSSLNYSCSKKDHYIVIAPATPPLIEYPIDLNFTINPACQIFYNFPYSDPMLEERDFYFFAYSHSSLPDDTSGSYINVSQTYFYYNDSFSVPQFIVSAKGQNGINYFGITPDSSDFNLFTLPYQNGFAFFSGTCQAAPAPGSMKYHTISSLKTQPLSFSGFFDLLNGTGSIRIKGSVYLSKIK